MDTAHPLENQQSAQVPHPSVDPDLKAEDRPTTALVIQLEPGKDGAWKVASSQAGGVALTDTELALVQHFREQQAAAEQAASDAAAADAAKTEVPASSLSAQDQADLAAFNAWKEMMRLQSQQTGQTTGDGTADYVGPSESGS